MVEIRQFRVPFEFVRGGDKIFVLTRSALHQVIGSGLESSRSSDARRKLNEIFSLSETASALLPTVIVLDPPDGLCDLIFIEDEQSYASVLSDDLKIQIVSEKAASNLDNKTPINLVVDSVGRMSLGSDVLESPIVHYSFDLKYRYRSNVYWPRSGRPCPRCFIALMVDWVPESHRKLLEASRLLAESQPDHLRPGVSRPSLLEVASCVLSAIRLGTRLASGDRGALDSIRYAEQFDLLTEERNLQIVPVDTVCSHDGFTL